MEPTVERVTLANGQVGYRSVPDGYLYVVKADTPEADAIAKEKATAYGLAVMDVNSPAPSPDPSRKNRRRKGRWKEE